MCYRAVHCTLSVLLTSTRCISVMVCLFCCYRSSKSSNLRWSQHANTFWCFTITSHRATRRRYSNAAAHLSSGTHGLLNWGARPQRRLTCSSATTSGPMPTRCCCVVQAIMWFRWALLVHKRFFKEFELSTSIMISSCCWVLDEGWGLRFLLWRSLLAQGCEGMYVCWIVALSLACSCGVQWPMFLNAFEALHLGQGFRQNHVLGPGCGAAVNQVCEIQERWHPCSIPFSHVNHPWQMLHLDWQVFGPCNIINFSIQISLREYVSNHNHMSCRHFTSLHKPVKFHSFSNQQHQHELQPDHKSQTDTAQVNPLVGRAKLLIIDKSCI